MYRQIWKEGYELGYYALLITNDSEERTLSLELNCKPESTHGMTIIDGQQGDTDYSGDI